MQLRLSMWLWSGYRLSTYTLSGLLVVGLVYLMCFQFEKPPQTNMKHIYEIAAADLQQPRLILTDQSKNSQRFNCEFSLSISDKDNISPVYNIVQNFNSPHEYTDEVNLRIIVLTYNRAESLKKCLNSIQTLEMDGDSGSLEIWIDRNAKTGKADAQTVKLAEDFVWKKGSKNVHIQENPVGIYGQWISTWRPRENSKELALILEEDVDVSPFAYRWLKAAVEKYGHLPAVGGYSLFEGALVDMKNPPDLMFLHSRLGAQAHAPTPQHWRRFQDWFYLKNKDPHFHPYVNEDPKPTGWYKGMEKGHTAHTSWARWGNRYYRDMGLWTIYPNFAAYAKAQGLNSTSDASFLAYHRQENGLHFRGKSRSSSNKLIDKWQDYFTNWPNSVQKYFYQGQRVGSIVV